MEKLTFNYILRKIKKLKFPKLDLIVAIGKDGIIPASLLQHFLNIPITVIWINYRDENNKPIRKEPKLMKSFKEIKNKKILLVDSVSRTGKTLEKAKTLLKLSNESEKGLGNSKNLQSGNKIKTFVINGKADYNIINKKECVLMPWK